jgi:hypothetical protein
MPGQPTAVTPGTTFLLIDQSPQRQKTKRVFPFLQDEPSIVTLSLAIESKHIAFLGKILGARKDVFPYSASGDFSKYRRVNEQSQNKYIPVVKLDLHSVWGEGF